MSRFTINNMVFDSDDDLSDSTFYPDDYDSCHSDTETDSDEMEGISDSEDEDELSELQREELLEEVLDLIRDAGYHYRIKQ